MRDARDISRPDFVVQAQASTFEAVILAFEKLSLETTLTPEDELELERRKGAYVFARAALRWVLEKEGMPESLTVTAFERFKQRVEK